MHVAKRSIATHRLLLAAVAGLLVLGTAIPPGEAAGPEIFTVRLNAGQTFAIHDVDPGATPRVRFSHNSNAFTIKNTGPRQFTIYTFQKGEGTIETRLHGTDVAYHVIVRGTVDSVHPLRAGSAGPALAGAKPATAATAASSGGSGYPDGPVTTKTLEAPASGTDSARNSDPQPGTSTTRTVAAPDPAPGIAGATYSGAGEQAQGPVMRKQFWTDPNATGSTGYKSNLKFGTGHSLPSTPISITSGTSQIYDFPSPISKVSVANTKVADVQILGSREVMLVGRKPGFTSLVVWNKQGDYVERLVYTDKAGSQQVLLKVTVAEVDLTKMQQMGIDFSTAFTNLGFTLVGLPGFVASPYSAGGQTGPTDMGPGGRPFPLQLSQNITYAVAGRNSNVSAFAFFQFLEQHDLGRILAHPVLLANSGQKAKFLSGGEIPIVITQALTSTIVFKQYGTSVAFVPTVIGNDIDLAVHPEVSKPDYTQSTYLYGFQVPAFVTRQAQTRVRLANGETFIIAGLILDDTHETIKKVPYLGDVPYLGAMFRQTYWDHQKTELVMSVTPKIVKPIPPSGQVALPQPQGNLTPQDIRTRPLSSPDAGRPRLW